MGRSPKVGFFDGKTVAAPSTGSYREFRVGACSGTDSLHGDRRQPCECLARGCYQEQWAPARAPGAVLSASGRRRCLGGMEGAGWARGGESWRLCERKPASEKMKRAPAISKAPLASPYVINSWNFHLAGSSNATSDHAFLVARVKVLPA
jgi:hypothetical protein